MFRINENIVKEKWRRQLLNAQELKKYKELLDKDIITQEEFEAKKKELLNLKQSNLRRKNMT